MTPPTTLKVASATPNEQTVATLKRWLADAESGELRGILLIGQVTGSRVRRAYAGEYTFPELTHACELAKHDLLHAAMEFDEELDQQ